MSGPPPLPPDVDELVRSYEPLLASPERDPLIRELVGWFGPKDRASAKAAAAAVSGLVHWAEQTGRPVDPDSLLAPAVVDSYVAQATALADQTREVQRSALRRIIRRRPGPNARSRPEAQPRIDLRLAYAPAVNAHVTAFRRRPTHSRSTDVPSSTTTSMTTRLRRGSGWTGEPAAQLRRRCRAPRRHGRPAGRRPTRPTCRR